MNSRSEFEALDAQDELAPWRDAFELPEGVIYLDGNSLGPLPKAVVQRVQQVVQEEWGRELIRSWNTADWLHLPQRVGARIARLIGAEPDEVIAADSTSVNLFKVLAAALEMCPGRAEVVSESGNFPTDLYIAEGVVHHASGERVLRLVSSDQVLEALSANTAVLLLTHVDYRSGQMHAMQEVTQRAHEVGALVIWDLSHSAGAMPVDLNACGADFAIGCGYKYLNGGPGAPAFLFVARRHQEAARQPLSGWLGHAQPFAFESGYTPAPGVDRFLCGTPGVLGMSALETALEVFESVDLQVVRSKSLLLSQHFMELVESRCAGFGLELATPREARLRGSQVSFAHPEAFAVMRALIAQGVIGDFRAPNLMRFGFTPLYTRFTDVWDAVEALREILQERRWDSPEFQQRTAVT
ncbi:MAG: kynureninase [bacterium]